MLRNCSSLLRTKAHRLRREQFLTFQYAEVTGSSPYNLCNVACGITEGHTELFVPSPHRAAGMLLVHEAGGKVENIGNINFDKYVLATNGQKKIHEELLAIAKKYH